MWQYTTVKFIINFNSGDYCQGLFVLVDEQREVSKGRRGSVVTSETHLWFYKTNLTVFRLIKSNSNQYGAACETYYDSADRTLPLRCRVAAVTAEGACGILLLLMGFVCFCDLFV